jgi:hypothetical protein
MASGERPLERLEDGFTLVLGNSDTVVTNLQAGESLLGDQADLDRHACPELDRVR